MAAPCGRKHCVFDTIGARGGRDVYRLGSQVVAGSLDDKRHGDTDAVPPRALKYSLHGGISNEVCTSVGGDMLYCMRLFTIMVIIAGEATRIAIYMGDPNDPLILLHDNKRLHGTNRLTRVSVRLHATSSIKRDDLGSLSSTAVTPAPP